jgi:uncharacterized membrane protein YozB (DUF420 family)
MASTSIPTARRPSIWRLVLVLAVLASLALWFVGNNVLYYVRYDPGTYGDFWPRRFGLLLHIAGGLLALSVGLVQIWLGLTGRTRALHRNLGRLYASGVLVGSFGAYYLAFTIDPKNFAYAAGLFMLATAWLITSGMAILAIRRRAYEQHREWMIRSYTVTFAFVTFRLINQWVGALHLAPQDALDITMAWACWSVPLLIAEPLLQLRRMHVR